MKPSVIREICGTESGYRKHRREDEERCEACKVAHNVHRRAKYDPDKNAKYGNKYKDKYIRPAAEAKRKAREDARAKKKAEVEARKADKKKRGIQYKAEREQRRIAYQKKLADSAERRRIEREGIEQRKAEQALRLEKKRAEKEAKAKKSEEARVARETKLAADKAAKAKRQEERNNQHGTNTGDYKRCRRNNNGEACQACREIVNAYVAKKSKEPKYKAKEKEWLRTHRPHNSRERAIKRGVPTQYYTRQHIIDRDGIDCYICKLPVDFEANHVQGQPGWEMYPHIEHVIPLAKGGHDTLENVKLAHAKCNIDKGVKLLDDEATA